MRSILVKGGVLWLAYAGACSGTASRTAPPSSAHPVIDRFSSRAGHLLVRDGKRALPGPDQPIDLERPPFLTRGLGPDGSPVRYYNFDVQSSVPATRYRFTHAGKHQPIEGQLDVIDVLPGDAGYSDFWQIAWVEVPATFVVASITNASQLVNLHVERSSSVVDCPVVPRGTTAHEAHGVEPATIDELWYRGVRVTCLGFGAPLTIDDGHVPTSPIYVTFATEAGPAGGFRAESAMPLQTHNVVFSLPGDLEYSPLWDVHIYDRAAFDTVHDANSATTAPVAGHGPLVNCPIVSLGAE